MGVEGGEAGSVSEVPLRTDWGRTKKVELTGRLASHSIHSLLTQQPAPLLPHPYTVGGCLESGDTCLRALCGGSRGYGPTGAEWS